MRELTGHKINPANDVLTVSAVDAPGSGGANHHYRISGFDTRNNPSIAGRQDETLIFGTTDIVFQNGPIGEVGVNGLTNETLLDILIDRMNGFQCGPYATADNEEALDALLYAQIALQRRTRARMARGVEGTHAI